ncbi:NTP transferase domain-containing protein [Vibrio parahaemolyticus]|uniref:phosphocholine cytidylyltransferase family protein n=2 Tax=Vibrio parahaemolyticus TaxID=670 RepID=UPI0009B71581|nr:sugar phosphate nucleotidyltransferase [Vibrio parahaemolyticus]ELB2259788.1 NTP transferase domain-containing protein [Vibrio parahaemolyticus]OQK18829.1 hypothetical protein XE88_u0058 [Vibrio parahaemolyticus]
MKKNVIILAAGIGSRLRPITETTPKSLVKVAGTPLLVRLVKQIIKNSTDHKITVVAGYLSEQIIHAMNVIDESIEVIINSDYDTTNNMESCRLALESTNYGDCVIVNADCIYSDEIVTKMLELNNTAIAIDSSEYFEENMKVKLQNDKVVEISKLLPEENNIFTSIDIYNFLQEDVNKLLEVMREYNENGVLDKWNEVAINDIANLTDISCVDFNGLSWMEVDNHDDLKKAEELFK